MPGQNTTYTPTTVAAYVRNVKRVEKHTSENLGKAYLMYA